MVWIIVALLGGFVLAMLIAVPAWSLWRLDDLSALDQAAYAVREGPPSAENKTVLALIGGIGEVTRGLYGKARLTALRKHMDGLGDGVELRSKLKRCELPKGEWVIAPGADTRRRVLYIHGGAWTAGSPRSHRAITDRLAQVANAAVFAVDYRLMPEHRFMDGVRDCRDAYRWLLENGPSGACEADFMLIAGDSAGGSHTLGLLAWLRDSGLRQADGAVAFSPSTDLTLTAPSNRRNIASDAMLGPMFGRLAKLPRALVWWGVRVIFRASPASAVVSPLRGSLADLPPTLIQASAAEMLVDNARRYASKATAVGSSVTLHLWPGMVHAWQIFTPLLPEAEEAFADVAAFIAELDA
ncbi:MAG: alpha/beta hydrolase [Halomonas subglaciescola]|nr:alpha/beta hydrolase [Halomonas subglaciescola]